MEDDRPGRSAWPGTTRLFTLTRIVVRAALRLLFRFRVDGLGHVPAGPAVIVANHPSALDPLFLAAALPERVVFVGAEEFMAVPLVGWAMRTYGCIPVRRGKADLSAIKDSIRALEDGRKVVVFPEGQVSPQPAPPQRGAALIAARTRAPFVPVALRGTDRVFPLGARIPRLAAVRVRIGLPQRSSAAGTQEYEAMLARAMAWVHAA
jgi:1-acyl-sn-glycerol-3-phosphate acyltransferase